MNSAITLTFGEQVESHAGMEKIGELADHGLSHEQLLTLEKWFKDKGCETELVDINEEELGEPAYVLVIQNGITALGVAADAVLAELNGLTPDTKAFMYGRVVNKHARHNLTFADFSQEAEYENKKGTVINFKDVPVVSKVRKQLNALLKKIGCGNVNMLAESNHYYDIKKCGIGFHGDTERRLVIGFRFGETIPLHFQWFHDRAPVGKRYVLEPPHGSVYFMSAKAVGFDWKKRSAYTIRHSAGCAKFTTIKS